jgi:predicted membrane protein
MFTINFDLFIWAAGIGDVFGIGVIILSVFFNKQLSKKVW